MEKDLTIIYITASQLPKEFVEWNRKSLLDQVGDFPIISISREPLEFGDMNILDETVGAMNWKREHTRDNQN